MTTEPAGRRGRPTRVLVVDDSAASRELVTRALTSEGIDVDHAVDLEDARRQLATAAPDVIVLDVLLPDGNGFDLLREIENGTGTPVIMLSINDGEVDRVLGLELGADDYVTKPFYPRELAARVRRAARRAESTSSDRLEFGDLTIDGSSREVRIRDLAVDLTSREFDLLAYLASTPRTVFSRQDLLRDVWRSSSEWQSEKTVTEHVRRVRYKIEDDPRRPRRIVTVAGAGYRFDP